jgi:acyl carrier protein
MVEALDERHIERILRAGFSPMASQKVVDLFDRALIEDLADPVLAEIDRSVLRSLAGAQTLPRILSALDPRAAESIKRSLAQKLSGVPEERWDSLILDLVREQAAAVLGFERGSQIDPGRTFKDLGMDSLGAVEFRNRINAASGLRLPPTLVFNHPSSSAVAEHVRSQLEVTSSSRRLQIEQELDTLEELLSQCDSDGNESRWCETRIRSLLARVAPASAGSISAEEVHAADADELISILERDFGPPPGKQMNQADPGSDNA